MKYVSSVTRACLPAFLLLMLLGCSTGAGQPDPAIGGNAAIQAGTSPGPADGSPVRAVALDAALADVAAYAPPPGGDPELYASLAAELERVLRELYASGDGAPVRGASALQPYQWTLAWCPQCTSLPSGTTTLYWRGRHYGDYNMDGLVTASDLTPLGINYNRTVELDADGLPAQSGDNEWAAVVDGSNDGLVGISDITPIGQNYGSRIIGYRIYLGTTTDRETFTWDTGFQPDPDDAGAACSVAFQTSRDAGKVQIYSYAFDRPELADGELLYARIVSWDGTEEGTPADVPVLSGPHAMFRCDTCHTMLDLAFRGPDLTCNTCHANPPEDGSAAWADVPGLHAQCLVCHESHGFVVDPPQSACGTCHAAIVTATAAAGMPECLGCHTAAHLPLDQPGTAQCTACHTAPPDVVGAAWTDAPGLHGTCASCHESHGFAVEVLVDVCDNCHSALIDGGHGGGSTACLDCHQSPHVPEVSLTGVPCIQCHANPPEDLAAEWADAPGDHAECLLCHIGEEHGVKPDPPESICADCHAETIAGSHSGVSGVCLDCHGYPHLPEYSLTAADCLACHPAPPEDAAAAWADAPGQHAECGLCHAVATHGDKPVPPESICADCHAETIAGSHSGTSGVCLDCHSYAHLPEFSITGTDCQSCHPAPPEDPLASWADAPSQHAECGQCHLEGLHGDKPVPPESICVDCHAETIAGSHSLVSGVCLDCHNHPHLPEFSITTADCQICHPAPPEDLTASWEDAPGQHAECGQCHLETEHGNKPQPPEAICVVCHGELLTAGHAGGSTNCLGCHSFVHLPVEADIHDLHSAAGVHCGSCHSMHGGMNPDREKCMGCHTDKAEHYPETECIVCHYGS